MTVSEYATDVVFADSPAFEQTYSSLLRHGLSGFGSADNMRLRGHVVPAKSGRVNCRFNTELYSAYQHH